MTSTPRFLSSAISFGRSGAAINGDQQLWAILLEATFDALAAQPVALLHPQRQKEFRRRAVTAQHFREQRQGGHAIDIVISKQHDAFMRIQRTPESERLLHAFAGAKMDRSAS